MIRIAISTWDIWSCGANQHSIIVDISEFGDGGPGRRNVDLLLGLRRAIAAQRVASALGGVVRGDSRDVAVLIPNPSPLRAKLAELFNKSEPGTLRNQAQAYLEGEWLKPAHEAIGANHQLNKKKKES